MPKLNPPPVAAVVVVVPKGLLLAGCPEAAWGWLKLKPPPAGLPLGIILAAMSCFLLTELKMYMLA